MPQVETGARLWFFPTLNSLSGFLKIHTSFCTSKMSLLFLEELKCFRSVVNLDDIFFHELIP
jgi:hypothetical protein